MYNYLLISYFIILFILIVLLFNNCQYTENFTIQFCKPPKKTIENNKCFDCSLFYSSALQDLKSSSDLQDFITKQNIYINNVFNKITDFIKNRKTICNSRTINDYITCFKKYTSFVECPLNVGDATCKFNDTFTELLISKASICVSKNICKTVDEFEVEILKEFYKQKELYVTCYNSFTEKDSPCIQLYSDFLNTRVKTDDYDETITRRKLDDELNKSASFAFQINNY